MDDSLCYLREEGDVNLLLFSVRNNKKTFEFKLSIYGVFVGKKRAQCLSGIDKNRMIFIPTQTIKSDEAFLPAA